MICVARLIGDYEVPEGGACFGIGEKKSLTSSSKPPVVASLICGRGRGLRMLEQSEVEYVGRSCPDVQACLLGELITEVRADF